MNDIKTSPAYARRFQRIRRYITCRLSEPLSLEVLSTIMHNSSYHFHWQLSAYTGTPLYRYIQQPHPRYACWRLVFSPRDRVTDTALDAGFQNVEPFSHVFRTAFGQGPTQFHQQPDRTE